MRTLVVALGLIAATSGAAQADTLDCTSGTCSSGSGIEFSFAGVSYASFAGALWSTTDLQPTSAALIDSFVRISGTNETVDGMNTSARPLENDESSSPQLTHDLLKSSIPTVTLPSYLTGTGGETYYQFLLDIEQAGSDPLLSMSQVKICTTRTGNKASVADGCAGTLRYNMDDPRAGTGDDGNDVLLNYTLNEANGPGDLFMYIPTSYLGNGSQKYVYLWSQFGLPSPDGNYDGYEDWAVRQPSGSADLNSISSLSSLTLENTPEPASLILLGSGLVVGSGLLRRSRKKAGKKPI